MAAAFLQMQSCSGACTPVFTRLEPADYTVISIDPSWNKSARVIWRSHSSPGRINTFPIMLPALRDRREDIMLLAEHFVQKHSALLGKDVSAISVALMDELDAHSWPGNIRELEGVIQRSLISASGSVLELTEPLGGKPQVARREDTPVVAVSDDLRAVEREHIRITLEKTHGAIAGKDGAAAMLGVPASTLRSKMKKLGIQRPRQSP